MFPLGEVLILKLNKFFPLSTAKARDIRYETSKSFNEKSDKTVVRKFEDSKFLSACKP